MTTPTTSSVTIDDLAKKLGMNLPAHDPAAVRIPVVDLSAEESAQAPEVDVEVDEEDDEENDEKRNPEKNRVRVSFSSSGFAKIGLVAGGSFLIIAAIVGFYSGVAGRVGQKAPEAAPAQAQEEETPEDARLADLQQSESQARAELALQRQREQLAEIQDQKPADPPNSTTTTAARPAATPARPTPSTRAAAPASTPRVSRVVDRSPPRPRPTSAPVRSAPTPVRSASVVARSAPPRLATPSVAAVNPQEEWQRLAQVGRFGSVAPTASVVSTSRSTVASATRPSTSPSRSSEAPSRAQPSTRTTTATATATATPAIERSSAPPLAQYVRTQSSPLRQIEAQVEDQSQRRVLVGSTASGELVSTIVWSAQATRSPRFLVQLSEPLLDSNEQIVLPTESFLVVTPRPLATDSALADLEVIAVVTDEAEYSLSPGSIVIRGADGDPLMAREERQGSTFGRDAMSVLSSVLSEVGGLLNRPTTQTSASISTGGGTSTTSSTTNPDPNILGAALEGGFGRLSEILDERNDAAISEVMESPQVFLVPGGTEVQVFVNRTMTF